MTDHYETLGVPRDAPLADIKRAVRKLRRQHNTDHHGGDDARMKAVNVAADILLDPDKRAAYDKRGPDIELDPATETARATLHKCFNQAIEVDGATDLVDMVGKMLEQGVANIETRIQSLKQQIRGLEQKPKNYIYKGGDERLDILGTIIKTRLAAAQHDLRTSVSGLESAKLSQTILKRDYEGCTPKELTIKQPRDYTIRTEFGTDYGRILRDPYGF